MDPLERLRGFDPGVAPPDARALMARAGRIRRRRYAVMSAATGTAALLVVAVAFLGRPQQASRSLSQSAPRERTLEAPPAAAGDALTAQREAASSLSAPASAVPTPATAAAKGAPAPAAAATQADARDEGMRVGIEASPQTVAPAGSVRFTIEACNRGRDRTLTFATSQRYDIEVRRGDRVVWRWSADRSFAQVLGEERWASGECRRYSETWEPAPVEPGGYDAVGVLTSQPAVRSQPVRVCVAAC